MTYSGVEMTTPRLGDLPGGASTEVAVPVRTGGRNTLLAASVDIVLPARKLDTNTPCISPIDAPVRPAQFTMRGGKVHRQTRQKPETESELWV